jgi:hypothetical protein
LMSILGEWSSDRDVDTRMANLSGTGTGDRSTARSCSAPAATTIAGKRLRRLGAGCAVRRPRSRLVLRTRSGSDQTVLDLLVGRNGHGTVRRTCLNPSTEHRLAGSRTPPKRQNQRSFQANGGLKGIPPSSQGGCPVGRADLSAARRGHALFLAAGSKPQDRPMAAGTGTIRVLRAPFVGSDRWERLSFVPVP